MPMKGVYEGYRNSEKGYSYTCVEGSGTLGTLERQETGG